MNGDADTGTGTGTGNWSALENIVATDGTVVATAVVRIVATVVLSSLGSC